MRHRNIRAHAHSSNDPSSVSAVPKHFHPQSTYRERPALEAGDLRHESGIGVLALGRDYVNNCRHHRQMINAHRIHYRIHFSHTRRPQTSKTPKKWLASNVRTWTESAAPQSTQIFECIGSASFATSTDAFCITAARA